MSQEIYYTSAPEGLKRGTSGFCTVAASDNIPRALWDRLETLSAYRHVAGAGAGAAGGGQNPVSFAHWSLTVTGKTHHVLSRIGDSGVDHTQRTNAFAHHIVLDGAEIEAAPGGPAWLLQQHGVMAAHWDGRVGALPPAHLPGGDDAPRICHAWAALLGDPGWGGLLADLFAKTPTRPVCILFAPGQDLLPLLAESIALLPPAARWNITFNTYFTSMPTSATCLWRCCLAGTPAADVGMRYAANGLILNLADRAQLPALAEGPHVTMARTGNATGTLHTAMRVPPKPSAGGAGGIKVPPVQPDTADAFVLDDSRAGLESPPDYPPPERSVEDSLDGEYSVAPLGQTLNPAIPRGMVRQADRMLEEAERQAELAIHRRRRQVVLMFAIAVAAIAGGAALIFVLSRGGAPPEAPPAANTRTPAQNDTPAAPEPPTSVAPVTPLPEPPAIVVKPKPAEPPTRGPVAAIITYPDVITALGGVERPALGTGIGDREQLVALRAADLDPARVAGLRVIFPTPDKPAVASNVSTYTSEGFGTLTAKSESRAGRPGVTLLWKGESDAGALEIGSITWDAARPGVLLQWHAAKLLGSPGLFNLVYWLLQSGAIELDTPRDSRQRVVFKPFALPAAFDFTGAGVEIAWPLDLPRDAIAVPVAKGLPEGWKVDHYADWPDADPTTHTPEAAMQVMKFKKSMDVSVADAIFTVVFQPGLGKAECNFAKQRDGHQKDLEQFESDLRAIDAQIAAAKAENAGLGGGAPEELLKKQRDLEALIGAYKKALAGYNEVTEFDVSFEMPDGVRLATVHFQRPKQNP